MRTERTYKQIATMTTKYNQPPPPSSSGIELHCVRSRQAKPPKACRHLVNQVPPIQLQEGLSGKSGTNSGNFDVHGSPKP